MKIRISVENSPDTVIGKNIGTGMYVGIRGKKEEIPKGYYIVADNSMTPIMQGVKPVASYRDAVAEIRKIRS